MGRNEEEETRGDEGVMSLKELVRKNRSYRRFHQDVPVPLETLKELVDLGRLSASGGNTQPLKYFLSYTSETNAKIFPLLGWARQLGNWPGPSEGERPAAYIIVLCDTEIAKVPASDHAIAAQSILLGATEKGLGGCMLGSVQREKCRAALGIPERFDVSLVIALGKPKEVVVVEPLPASGDTKYWRDEKQVHHVPKRSLEDIIVGAG